MSKIFSRITFFNLYYVFLFIFVCKPIFSIACTDLFCECHDQEEFVNYHELEQYEEMYREFEIALDSEDENLAASLSLAKWGKNIKNWFKKRTVQMLKKCIDLKKCGNPDYAAYMVCKFKRKVDVVHNTGDIENLLREFDRKTPYTEMFKEKIRYYYKNKHAKPGKTPHYKLSNGIKCSSDGRGKDNKNGFENYTVKQMLGGLEMGCGFLIRAIPFRGCKELGTILITHGAYLMYDEWVEMESEKDKKRRPELYSNTLPSRQSSLSLKLFTRVNS